MARKGKGKGNASASKAASSEANNAAKKAYTEPQASTPMELEGAENGENATEVTNVEDNSKDVMHREENTVEEEVNGVSAAEKQDEDGNCVDNGHITVEEVNEDIEAEKQGEEDLCLNKQEEEDNFLNKDGENAVEGESSGGNEAEKQKEETCADKEKSEENAVVEDVSGSNVADKQEGTCADEENNGENVDMCKEKSENQHHLLEETKDEEENKGNVGEKNEDQDAVEEEIDKDNETEQHVGSVEGKLERQNTTTRKRTRKRNKWPLKKKMRKGNNGPEQEGEIEGNDAPEIHANEDNPSDGNKGKEKVVADAEAGGENVKGNDQKEVAESSKGKVIDLRTVKRRNKAAERALGKLNSQGKLKQKSATKKASKTVGMIFMCSSATKQDCYRYKVLGLPASKRNLVESIYKGMRLFLYDVDLKMLYGIYKAAGNGGYNIEPKAFNSQFPSQVRFIISEDCLPLAEEKFKVAIRDNYFTNKKFDCQLNSEQVKNLCKLFETSANASWPRTLGGRARRRAETKKLNRDRIRRRDEVRGPSLRDKGRQRERSRVHTSPVPTLHRGPAVVPLAATSSFAYERTLPREVYRQEPPIERRESYPQSRLSDLDDTVRDPYTERPEYRQGQSLEHHDPYRRGPLLQSRYALRHEPLLESRDSLRREPLLESRDTLRREPLMESRDSLRREPLFESRDALRREPLMESRDTLRREPLMESRDTLRREPLLESRETLRREPLLDSRGSLRREPLLESRDTLRHAPLLESRDTLRREPLLESRDTLRREVVRDSYRREPVLEYSDSYREERLLSRDLYRPEVRSEHRDRPMLNLEPRRHSENGSSRDIRSLYGEQSSYNDRVYSTSRPAEYHQPTSRIPEYHQTTSRAAEYHQRVEMPSRGLTVAYRSSAGLPLDYYSRRPAH